MTFTLLGLQDPVLANLTQSLFVDGSIGRLDMIQILQSVVAAAGSVSATDITDLQTIIANSATLSMPGFVKVLAGDVINGNTANAHYQGQTLGNLTAGSPASRLNSLINKWFFGADHPTIDANVPAGQNWTYRSASGSLFSGAPSHNDEFQGQLGDCYYVTSLGTVADKSAAAIQNMFLDNGDGTWTVRFYANGTADYVTVDGMLPADASGRLVYDNYGSMFNNSANTLWIPLAEKAYAQWNETGKEGRDGTNRYSSIEGGWPEITYAQILGHAAASYSLANQQQTLINAMNSNRSVTICTAYNAQSYGYGLYGNHAYGVIGYNSSTSTFTLYNPWGSNQPNGALTYAQLQSTCTAFEVADTAGTVPISAAVGSAAIAPIASLFDTTAMDTSRTRQAMSTDGDIIFSSRQELRTEASQEKKVREHLISAKTAADIDLPQNPAASKTSAGKHSKNITPLDISLLAIDEFFRNGGSLSLN